MSEQSEQPSPLVLTVHTYTCVIAGKTITLNENRVALGTKPPDMPRFFIVLVVTSPQGQQASASYAVPGETLEEAVGNLMATVDKRLVEFRAELSKQRLVVASGMPALSHQQRRGIERQQ